MGVGYVLAGTNLAKSLAGRILLQVGSQGEAWYVDPLNYTRYYLGRPSDCFDIMRSKGLGITNSNLEQITIAPDSKIPNITQGWVIYNKDFNNSDAGLSNISFKYPPYLHIGTDGKISNGCTNCSASTDITPNGPGRNIYSIMITQSQSYLAVDEKINFEYKIAKSATDKSFLTVKTIEKESNIYPSFLQAITPQVNGLYYKFSMEFNSGVNDVNMQEFKNIFQEILNSINYQ